MCMQRMFFSHTKKKLHFFCFLQVTLVVLWAYLLVPVSWQFLRLSNLFSTNHWEWHFYKKRKNECLLHDLLQLVKKADKNSRWKLVRIQLSNDWRQWQNSIHAQRQWILTELVMTSPKSSLSRWISCTH